LQVWDILRSIDYLVEGEGLQLDSVSLFGRKTMAALAFYAAALDPRISRVIVDNPPATHWHNAPLLNVLRVTDLPESAALLAPRELVSLGPLPREYDFTSAIYELYSAADHVRAAGGLGEALQVWKYPHAIGGPRPLSEAGIAAGESSKDTYRGGYTSAIPAPTKTNKGALAISLVVDLAQVHVVVQHAQRNDRKRKHIRFRFEMAAKRMAPVRQRHMGMNPPADHVAVHADDVRRIRGVFRKDILRRKVPVAHRVNVIIADRARR
jgi:hypothetical protein